MRSSRSWLASLLTCCWCFGCISPVVAVHGQIGNDSLWKQYCWKALRAYLGTNGFYEAERYFQLALAESEKFPTGDIRLPEALCNLALVDTKIRRYAEAKVNYERALALTKRFHSSNGEMLSTILIELGTVSFALQGYQDAERYLLTAISIRQQMKKPVDAKLFEAQKMLRKNYIEGGRPLQALTIIKQQLADWQRDDGTASPDYCDLVLDEHRAYMDSRQFEKAAEILYEPITLRKQAKVQRDRILPVLIHNLVRSYLFQFNFSRALAMLPAVFPMWEAIAPHHEEMAIIDVERMAALCMHAKRTAEAKMYGRRFIQAKYPLVIEGNLVPFLDELALSFKRDGEEELASALSKTIRLWRTEHK